MKNKKLTRPMILQALAKNPGASASRLAKLLDGSARTVQRVLVLALADGLVFRAGPKLLAAFFSSAALAAAWVSPVRIKPPKPPQLGKWTDAHVALLREHYPTQGAAWVSERTGHSVCGTVQHAMRLGVRCVVIKRKDVERKRKAVTVTVAGAVKVVAKPLGRGPAHTAAPADMSRAVITRAPTPLGRYAVDADYVGSFALVGIGRDIQSGLRWAR